MQKAGALRGTGGSPWGQLEQIEGAVPSPGLCTRPSSRRQGSPVVRALPWDSGDLLCPRRPVPSWPLRLSGPVALCAVRTACKAGARWGPWMGSGVLPEAVLPSPAQAGTLAWRLHFTQAPGRTACAGLSCRIWPGAIPPWGGLKGQRLRCPPGPWPPRLTQLGPAAGSPLWLSLEQRQARPWRGALHAAGSPPAADRPFPVQSEISKHSQGHDRPVAQN